jgi:hypothetical protein
MSAKYELGLYIPEDIIHHSHRRETIKILQRMVSSGMLRRVALVRTDVSAELSPSFIRVTRIGELGTTLAVTNTLRRNTK